MISFVRRHPVAAFFVLTYVLTWSVWVPMAVGGVTVRQGSAWPTHVAGLFGPMSAAIIVSAVTAGRGGLARLARASIRWRVDARWYLVALSPALFFALAAVGMAVAGRGVPDIAELSRFSGLPAVAAPLMWLLLMVAAYGEESGWRGFAVDSLLRRHSLLPTALVVGVLWAAWHVPSLLVIQNYRDLGSGMLPGFFSGIIAGSIFLAWLYRETGGSILMVTLWHGTYNLFAGTAAAHGTVAAIVSMGVMAWAIVIVGVELWRRRRGRRPSQGVIAAAR